MRKQGDRKIEKNGAEIATTCKMGFVTDMKKFL